MSILSSLAAYKLVRLLSKPFEKWEAFSLGLIDKDGNTLRKAKTDIEKKAFGMFERLIRKIKQIMRKAPLGAFKIASLAIALKLLKENTGYDLTNELEQFGVSNKLLSENYIKNETISKDKYKDDNDNIFIVKEDLSPIDNILGINIYEVFEIVTKERLIITSQTIKKLQ